MVDVSKPTAARLYDFLLEGDHYYKVDKMLGREILLECPMIRPLAYQNRAFLERAVRYAATECGVRQFLDIGSGIPTQGNVHQVAQDVDPACRVVYVDKDDEAVITSRALLAENPRATCIQANFLDPTSILDHPDTQQLIDFAQPVALLVVALLHFIGDQHDPQGKLQTYLDRLAPGSVLAASHVAVDEAGESERQQMLLTVEKYSSTKDPGLLRTRDEFTGFFAGLNIVDPGVTYVADWRPTRPVPPEEEAARRCVYAAVGLKP